jgi:hypothetical protein
MDGHIGQHLLVVAWGPLSTFLRGMKFGCLIVGGVCGGNDAQLLDGVPENVIVSIVVRVPHMAFRLCALDALAILSVSLGFNMPPLLP